MKTRKQKRQCLGPGKGTSILWWWRPYSRVPLRLDKMAQTRPRLCLYTFPLIALLPVVLAIVCPDQIHLLLVTPHWPADVSLGDSCPEGSSFTGTGGHYSSSAINVEHLGRAPEGVQIKNSGLSTNVVEIVGSQIHF